MKIRWLVVGIGDITSKRVIPAILAEPGSELAALVTRDPAKGEPYGCRVHTDFEEAIAQPDIDGGLIGGASLKAEEFVAIRAAAQ